MGWSLGFDERWKRDVGYAVPAICDQPGCGEVIDRGLSSVCGSEPFGGEHGCGLFFCAEHIAYAPDGHDLEGRWSFCDRCLAGEPPHPATPDSSEWIVHKLMDPSWAEWRAENPSWREAHETISAELARLDLLRDRLNPGAPPLSDVEGQGA